MEIDELIKKLASSNLKQVHRDTKIPYDRMFKWTKGKGNPKKDDFETLVRYFESGTNSIFKERVDNDFRDTQVDVHEILRSQEELYSKIIAEKDERLKDKDLIIETKDNLILAKEESLQLWKEKAIDYEKKISTGSTAMGDKGHARPARGHAGK